MENFDITKTAMIAKLTVSCWGNRKTDKDASIETNTRYNAEQKASAVSKTLLPKENLEMVLKKKREIEAYHKQNTLATENCRLLPAKKYEEYTKMINKLSMEYEEQYTAFLRNYESYINEARNMLGDLFNHDDYPPEHKIKEKFKVKLDFENIPTADDFKIPMSNEDLEKIKQEISTRNKTMIDSAMGDIWGRLRERVEKINQITSPEKKPSEKSFKKLAEVLKTLPELNITNNPDLEKILKDVSESLTEYSAKDTRDSDSIKTHVNTESKRILENIDSFI